MRAWEGVAGREEKQISLPSTTAPKGMILDLGDLGHRATHGAREGQLGMRTSSEPSSAARHSGSEPRRRGEIDAGAMELMLDQMADGVRVVDKDGVIRFGNPAAAKLFGRTSREREGQSLGFPVL